MEVERLQAVLDASGLAGFRASMEQADRATGNVRRDLEKLEAVSKVTGEALNKIRIVASQAAETGSSTEFMRKALRKVADTAEQAQGALDEVRIGSGAAFESAKNGDVIDRKLKQITGNANEARRAIESVNITAHFAGAGGGGGLPGRGPVRTTGSGVGPFGSGFGRLGVLGTAIGAGVLAGPAAGPGALGLLAALPAIGVGGVGALGTLALAFSGVAKAIGGDKKAFEALTPAQQKFALTVRSLHGELQKLKQTAAQAMFPGLTAALHDTLTPSFLGVVTHALKAFGSAIGQAGQIVGHYFGSREFAHVFGPLLQQGAHGIVGLARVLVMLADTLGRVGDGARPLVRWLGLLAERGAAWLNQWVRAKQATGQFSAAMREARSSLTIVAKLVASLWHVVMALGRALYPVAKVAVQALIIGLNALSGMINRNRQMIRELVGGALAGLVGAIRTTFGVLGPLVRMILVATRATIGFRNATYLLIGAWASFKFAAVIKGLAGATSVASAASAATKQVTFLRSALLTLGSPAVISALMLATVGGYKLGQMLGGKANGPFGPKLDHPVVTNQGNRVSLSFPKGSGVPSLTVDLAKLLDRRLGTSKASPFLDFNGKPLSIAAAAKDLGEPAGKLMKVLGRASSISDLQTTLLEIAGTNDWMTGGAGKGAAAKFAMPKFAAYVPPKIPDDQGLFGKVPPFTKNLGPKPPKIPALTQVFGLARQTAFSDAVSRFRAATGAGTTPLEQLHAANGLLLRMGRQLSFLNSEESKYTAGSKQLLALKQQEARVQGEITKAQTTQLKALKALNVEHVQGRMARILGIGGEGSAAAGARRLQANERKVLLAELERLTGGPHVKGATGSLLPAGATSASLRQLVAMIEHQGVNLPTSTKRSLAKINEVLQMSLKQHVKLSAEVSQNIQQRLVEINDTLKNRGLDHGTLHAVSAETVVRALGLHGPKAREAESVLAQWNAHGGMRPSGLSALGMTVHGGITINVNAGDHPDAKHLARQVHAELLKEASRNGLRHRTGVGIG